MRKPEHTFIQIACDATVADRIEDMISPLFTLALMPAELQDQDEDAVPIYFLAPTELGAAMMKKNQTRSF